MFYDAIGDAVYHYFKRDEKAWIIGNDLIFGKSKNILKSKFYLDLHFGLGFRYKNRKFDVVESGINGLSSWGYDVGNYHDVLFYTTAIFGISIGFDIKKEIAKEEISL